MTINFPMWLLDEEAPRCSPADEELDLKLSLIDRKAPFLPLYQTLTALGHTVGEFAAGACDLNVFWTGKRVPESETDRSIIMEVGWLPRSHYQISPTGSNHASHHAQEYAFAPLDDEKTSFIRDYVRMLRAIFERRVDPCRVKRLEQTLPDAFVLFPLQLANDFNLKFSGTPFARFHSTDQDANASLARACMQAIASSQPPVPVVFKQHPLDATNLAPDLPHQQVLRSGDRISSHDLFATGRCKLVVAINSNTIHEAAAWNIPSICLGNLIWNDRSAVRPFSSSLADLPHVMESAPLDEMRVLSYLDHLVRHQWTLSDFQNPLMVDALLRTLGRCTPFELRQRCGLL